MHSNDQKQVFNTPGAVFVDPRRVIDAPGLSYDEKLVVLRNWKRSLERSRSGRRAPRFGLEQLDEDSRLAAVKDALRSLNSMRTTH